MKILMKLMLITSVYSIKENLAEATTTPQTPSNEIKKIKRGVLGLTNVQPPSGHFHYYPFAHSQHSNAPIAQQQINSQQSYNPNPQNIKPVQDNTPDSQFTYQNPQQIIPQENNQNGFIGSLEQQPATISPYFPIAPLSDSNHPQQYSPTNHYAASATHYEPTHPQPAAQFPVHIEPAYIVASSTQQRVPTGQYHSTVQHYPAYWNGNPQFPPQQQPIKYPTLLNGNKPQLYQPQQSQGYPINNPGSVAPQQFLTNKNYYPQNTIKHYNQANFATASPVKYTLSSVLPISFTTPGPLSAHVKNHPLLLPQYKKNSPTTVKNTKEQPKSKKEEIEYDDEKSEDKSDHEDVEDDDEPSPRRKPKYNNPYRSKNYDNDEDDYYSRFRYNDESDEDDDYSSSPIRDDRDEDEEADTAATSFKSKTKYDKKTGTAKVSNNKYINNNNKNNRYNKGKPNVQKSSNYKPAKSKTDVIEGKYSHQVPVTTDQKSKSHYQAKWYTYSSVNNNED